MTCLCLYSFFVGFFWANYCADSAAVKPQSFNQSFSGGQVQKLIVSFALLSALRQCCNVTSILQQESDENFFSVKCTQTVKIINNSLKCQFLSTPVRCIYLR